MSIVVFGSINMDLVAQVKHLPDPAETITGKRFFTAPGGKGANQAVATARLGATTYMVGKVGDDEFGKILRQSLADVGVQVPTVEKVPGISSGVALIAVEDSGQNHIIVVPGANGQVNTDDLRNLEQVLTNARLLLLQLEIPLDANLAAVSMACKQKIPIVLDPAPFSNLPSTLFSKIDVITPNEVEASHLVGFPVKEPNDAYRAAEILLNKGVRKVVIKLGAKGAVYATRYPDSRGYIPSFPVTAIDTVAAGDAFNGGLAVALSEEVDFPEAVRWGAAAGALSTTKAGAQSAMPERTEVLHLLARD